MIEYSSLKRDMMNDALKENNCLLLGPVSNKTIEEESKGICHYQILKELDIYASVSNPISFEEDGVNGKDVDLLIIQQTDKGFKSNYNSSIEYDEVS